MSDISIIFCGKCHSERIDSGLRGKNNFKCIDCGNTEEFLLGKVFLDKYTQDKEGLLNEAKKEAFIK